MSKTDAELIGVASLMLLAAGEVPNFLAGMLPSILTIKRFGSDDEDRAALRRGEVAGAGLSIMVGVGASLAADSWLPLLSVSVILGLMLYMYEEAIRNPHPDNMPISDKRNLPNG